MGAVQAPSFVALGNDEVAVAVGGHAGYESGFLHLFQQAGGAVVADAQVALHERDGRPAVLQHDGHGLIVHGIGLATALAHRHLAVGAAFEHAYKAYETKADNGELKLFKRIPAMDLWRKMLSMLFETGHPWLTFKLSLIHI